MSKDNSQCDVFDVTSLGFSRRVLRDDNYSRLSRSLLSNPEKADELVNELSPNDNFLLLSSGKFTNGLNDIHNVSWLLLTVIFVSFTLTCLFITH